MMMTSIQTCRYATLNRGIDLVEINDLVYFKMKKYTYAKTTQFDFTKGRNWN